MEWAPIYNKICLSVVKYWMRTYKNNGNKLLNAVFKYSRENKSPWKDGMQNVLCSNGFANVWKKPNSEKEAEIMKEISKRLTDVYIQESITKIKESKKLND